MERNMKMREQRSIEEEQVAINFDLFIARTKLVFFDQNDL